jgi:hypothetical protein
MATVTPRPHFSPRERTPGTHCTGGWVAHIAGLDTEARGKILSPLPGIEPSSPGRLARSQTLYWLSYPAHQNKAHNHYKHKYIKKAVPLHAMEERGGERIYSSYSFTTSALDGGEWSESRHGGALPPGTHWTGGWVGLGAGLDTESFAPAGDRIPIARMSSP